MDNENIKLHKQKTTLGFPINRWETEGVRGNCNDNCLRAKPEGTEGMRRHRAVGGRKLSRHAILNLTL